jgi:hypothetical protein
MYRIYRKLLSADTGASGGGGAAGGDAGTTTDTTATDQAAGATGAGTSQADTQASSQAGQAQTTQTQATGGSTDTTNPQAGAASEVTLDQLLDETALPTLSIENAKKLRSEAKNLRDRAQTAEGGIAAAQGQIGTLTQERDRYKGEAAQAKSELQELRISSAVESAARAVGAEYPDAILALLDRKAIKFDDKTGAPVGIAELVAALKASKPTLFTANVGTGSLDAGATGATGGSTNTGVGRMRDAYAAAAQQS